MPMCFQQIQRTCSRFGVCVCQFKIFIAPLLLNYFNHLCLVKPRKTLMEGVDAAGI